MNSTHSSFEEGQTPEERRYVLHRRFDRIARLVGDATMKRHRDAHIMIIGVGGVGSFAAESLARSGAGRLSLVDFDDICVTNANRQLHALQPTIGKKKAEVMAERLSRINPQAEIQAVAQFYNADTAETLLASKPDLILDCIDNITAKCHLLATCRERGIAVIASGGAGSRVDPLKITVGDLAAAHAARAGVR